MLQLNTLLGDYAGTSALKKGEITSDTVALEFADFQPTNTGFKPMVREGRFDVSEMAIVTYLIAKAHGKPMVLLPATVVGRFQHDYALYNRAHAPVTPADLAGKRVGIRSFTTTTGAWIRGILANDYRVDLDRVRWTTFEEPHVAEYVDTTERAPQGKKILDMALAGELDAVLGERSHDARFATLFPDPAAEAKAWYGRHGIVPVNHMVVVSEKLAQANPDAVREVFRLLKASKAKAPKPAADAIDFCPFGLEPLRKPLQAIIQYAAQQRLIPRAYAVEELFDDTTRLLS